MLNIKNLIVNKNTIMMGDGEEWFLYSPSDFSYPCLVKGQDGYFDLESIQFNYELVGWTSDGEAQEVDGVLYYYQLPIIKRL